MNIIENKYHLILELPTYLPLNLTIIDLETTGIYPEKNEIISIAFNEKKRIISIINLDYSEEGMQRFYGLIKKRIKETLKPPFFAFNADFDSQFIQYKLGLNLNMFDVMSIPKRICSNARKKGFNIKWPKLSEITGASLLKYFGIKIPESKNSRIIRAWKEFSKTKNVASIIEIGVHNIIDILRTIEAINWMPFLEIINDESGNSLFLKLNNISVQEANFNFVCEFCGEEKEPESLFSVSELLESKHSSKKHFPNYFFICKDCLV